MEVERIEVVGWREVQRLVHEPSGLRAWLAIHADPFGRAFGGIRIRRYASEADGLEDAKALARAMTCKTVFWDIPGGGAKTVVLEHEGLRRTEAVAALGAYVESLGGRYRCGGDLGFTAEDERTLRSATRWVACSGLDEATATGVVASIEGVLETVGGGPLRAQHVLVQGAGAIGAAVARRLRDVGVRVTVADIDSARTEIDPETIWDVEADVFCPCAVGGVIDARTVERLKARAVVGGANVPLAGPEIATRLHERGVVYVPDYVSNAGATIRGALGMLDRAAEAGPRLQTMRARVAELVARAAAEGRPPLAVADAIVAERLAAWSGSEDAA